MFILSLTEDFCVNEFTFFGGSTGKYLDKIPLTQR